MFKHILIPTDGSSLSSSALDRGLALAKAMDAKVTVLHVTAPFHVVTTDSVALSDTRVQYERHVEAQARAITGSAEASAKDKGVNARGIYVVAEHPYEAIIKTAKEEGCDLILMASHGWRGVKALLLGSETQKVLTHSAIPVLVYR
ncbi:MAG TPA: universal stress protein [Burkholderiales bacterium]|jgi:nucleotide-binding universal stress UspA family protein|nr:universal stress protein [Burkholderiales bacterium]